MSYGHCIVLPNQNRDTVQIITVQDKAALKEYKSVGNYTAQQDFRWVPRVYMSLVEKGLSFRPDKPISPGSVTNWDPWGHWSRFVRPGSCRASWGHWSRFVWPLWS